MRHLTLFQKQSSDRHIFARKIKDKTICSLPMWIVGDLTSDPIDYLLEHPTNIIHKSGPTLIQVIGQSIRTNLL